MKFRRESSSAHKVRAFACAAALAAEPYAGLHWQQACNLSLHATLAIYPKMKILHESSSAHTVRAFSCATALAAKNCAGLCREQVLNSPFEVTLASYPKIKIHCGS